MLIADRLADKKGELAGDGVSPAAAQKRILRDMAGGFRQSIWRERRPVGPGRLDRAGLGQPHQHLRGPLFRVVRSRSPQARWNSFNTGEFLFPDSRLSLLPLLGLLGALGLSLVWKKVRSDVASLLPGSPEALPEEEIALD